MPEHILPLPPKWEKDVECGWVTFNRGGTDLRGYFAKPKGGANLPAIIMVPENLGIIEHRQDVTRRFAKAGYACITVDPYSRVGGQSPRDFKDATERRIKASLAAPDEQFVPDVQAATDWMAARPDVEASRIGAIGYCSGGGTAYAWLCGQSKGIKCAVIFYGAPRSRGDSRPDGKDLDRAANASKLQCPILIHHGDADRSVALDEAKRMVEALKKSSQPVEFHIYGGADHAYHDDTHPQYHGDAAKTSWQRTLDFFAKYLMNTPAARAVAG